MVMVSQLLIIINLFLIYWHVYRVWKHGYYTRIQVLTVFVDVFNVADGEGFIYFVIKHYRRSGSTPTYKLIKHYKTY